MYLYLITFAILIFCSLTDIKKREIPNFAIILLLITGVVISVFFSEITSRIIGLLFPSLILFIFFLFGKAVGAGDVKLIAATGLNFGWELNIFILLSSLILALLYALIRRLFFKKTASVPFAPFVCISSIIIVPLALLNQV